ncbi:hypothetical protein HBA_0231 [Sodalis endosymbiont of Henestaris halophilus]|nr:hypothetical protein HBA_0231 [Sodalis endosymbiont of Henestaris halophilus]
MRSTCLYSLSRIENTFHMCTYEPQIKREPLSQHKSIIADFT